MTDTATEKAPDAPKKTVSIFGLYEVDTDLQETGKWFKDVMADGKGVDLKLRRVSSKYASRIRIELDKQYADHLDKNGQYTNEDIAIDVLCKHLGTGVVADWRGPMFVNEDGSPMPYSADVAVVLMTRIPDLRARILQLSMDLENFRLHAQKATEKN